MIEKTKKKLHRLFNPLYEPDEKTKEYLNIIRESHQKAFDILDDVENKIMRELDTLPLTIINALLEEHAQFEYKILRR